MPVSFVKLFNTLTDSSVWALPDNIRVIWISMLSMCNSRGNVHASVLGVANRARKSVEEVEEALRLFMSPDPYSRTKVDEGRRLVEIEGGWHFVTWDVHRRALDAEAARESKRKWWAANRATATEMAAKLDIPRPGSPTSEPAENKPLDGKLDELEKTRKSGSISSLSGSDLDPEGVQGEPIAAPGRRHVYYTLDGWEISADLRAEAVIAGVPPEDIDQRVKDLKNGPVGGRRGVIDRDEYVRAQFPKWRTWAEVDRAKANSGAATGSRSSFGSSRVSASTWEPNAKHKAIAERFGLDLGMYARSYIRSGVPDKRSLADANEDFAKRLMLVARGKPFGIEVAA